MKNTGKPPCDMTTLCPWPKWCKPYCWYLYLYIGGCELQSCSTTPAPPPTTVPPPATCLVIFYILIKWKKDQAEFECQNISSFCQIK